MACFVPFNNRNLETSFFIFRPIVALVDELVETLKHFSACTESLGCVQSSIFKSIHGNMVRNYVVLLDQLKYISIWKKKERKKEMTNQLGGLNFECCSLVLCNSLFPVGNNVASYNFSCFFGVSFPYWYILHGNTIILVKCHHLES